MKSLVVLSGGMDSAVALAKCLNIGDEVKCITFNYGSKHNDKEYECAKKLCEKFRVDLKKVYLPLDGLFKSDLLKSGGEIPEGHYEDETMKKTVVPFRNGIMLAIACGYAESLGYEQVVIGNHAGDHAIYPDCRAIFISAMNEAMEHGTYNKVNIYSPFCSLSKREIGLLGEQLMIEWNDTWSCYKGKEVHCGKCGTCVERIEALEGFDPTEYKDV
jgi:7-cyano-7-deazaguanine synthase